MKRYLYKIGWLALGIIFIMMSRPLFAESSPTVTITGKEVVQGDKYVGTQIFKNDGVIKGDLVFWAQNVSSQGTIEGDAIGLGQTIDLAGNIRGDVRAAGATVNLSGQTGKNVTALGGVITLNRDAVVNGSVTAFGGKVNLDGKIKGKVLIGGRNIVLGGEFFGDVDVNNFGIREKRFDHAASKATLTVLPGTIIHGTLKFRGTRADIQQGAKVDDFQWIKPKVSAPEKQKQEFYRYLWKFVRLMVTTAVYFLLGLLLFKLFPAFVGHAVEFISRKPWNAVGYGLMAVFSTIAAAVACIILLAMSLVMSPKFAFVSSIAATGFYALLFFLAMAPVALWLGTLILKEKPQAYRFGLGLITLNVAIYVLKVLGGLPAIGPIFPALALVVKFGIVLLGSGALLHAVSQVYLAGKRQEV